MCIWGCLHLCFAGPLGTVVQSVSAGTLLRIYSQSFVPGAVGLVSGPDNQAFDSPGNDAVVSVCVNVHYSCVVFVRGYVGLCVTVRGRDCSSS